VLECPWAGWRNALISAVVTGRAGVVFCDPSGVSLLLMTGLRVRLSQSSWIFRRRSPA
jgi:hypothetical protein